MAAEPVTVGPRQPWQVPTVPFWNAPFGVVRPIPEPPDADAVLAFFHQGRTVDIT